MHGNPGSTRATLTLSHQGVEPITTSGWLSAAALSTALRVAGQNPALQVEPGPAPPGAAIERPPQFPDFAMLGLPFLTGLNQFDLQDPSPASTLGESADSEVPKHAAHPHLL